MATFISRGLEAQIFEEQNRQQILNDLASGGVCATWSGAPSWAVSSYGFSTSTAKNLGGAPITSPYIQDMYKIKVQPAVDGNRLLGEIDALLGTIKSTKHAR